MINPEQQPEPLNQPQQDALAEIYRQAEGRFKLTALFQEKALREAQIAAANAQREAAERVAVAKGTPAADVRRYFPGVATIHGITTTEANALHQLAVWLLHWAERHGHKLTSNEYSLAGQLRKQQAAHPNTGKFLKACRRLHEALLMLAADEQGVKQLLGNEYGPHSRTNLAAVLKWWAGWIKEQQAAHDDPAGAYLAALRRVPVVEVWENGSPYYSIPAYLIGFDDFEAEIAPLRHLFEAALPDLPTKKKQALRHELNKLLSIDRAGVQRCREQFERGEYGLNFLPADYPALRFDVAGQPGSFKWQWVGPLFWGGLTTLLQYKQGAARAACEQLSATLPEAARLGEVPDAPPATPLLTPAAIRTLYLKLLEHPALVSELSAYQKSELRAYAEAEQLSATRLAVELMDGNPNYNYPAGYPNGREVEYWQGTISTYADSERVLRLLAPTPPAPAVSVLTNLIGAPSIQETLARHVPHVFWPHRTYPTDADALREWAFHLQSPEWSARDEWPVSLRYETLYYAAPDAAALLAGLTLLQAAVTPHLRDEATAAALFGDDWPADEAARRAMWNRCRVGASRLGVWLRSKADSPAEQLLNALAVVRIAEQEQEGKPCPAHGFWPLGIVLNNNYEQRFQLLLRDFEKFVQAGGLTPEATRLLAVRLGALKDLPLEEVLTLRAKVESGELSLAGIVSRYPAFRWAGHHAGQRLAPDFWQGLGYVLAGRIRRAWQAYSVLAVAAGLPAAPDPAEPLPPAATPAPDAGAESTGYPWADIDALAEKIGLRKSGAFTPAGNRIKAAVAGFIDALREAGTVPATDTLPQLYAAFGAHYGREVGADRVNDTRADWQRKARQALGLDN